MNSALSQRKIGAPVRALVLIFGCWFVGRLIWLVFPAQPELEAVASAQNQSDKPAIQSRMKIPAADFKRLSKFKNHEPYKIVDTRTRRVVLAIEDRGNQVSFRPHFGAKTIEPSPIRDEEIMSRVMTQKPNFQNQSKNQASNGTASSPSFRKDVMANLIRSEDTNSGSRLSGYFWLFARQNGGAGNLNRPLLGTAPVTYGGTQAGASLSYRVAGSSKNHISLFTRISTAKAARRWATDQEQLAVGLKIRPFTSIPVTVHAEQRLDIESGNNEGTALYLSGGTDPKPLVAGVELETYAQAGIVLHSRDQFFFDGSATLQKHIVRKNRKSVSVGVGIWAGGQRDVRRIDVGPRVEFQLPVGKKQAARISLDWRQKVSGNASPDDGVAVTVSSGF